MSQVEKLGGPTWFRLRDRDLATHAMRTERLKLGATLTAITADLCNALSVNARILPMTNDRVRTIVHTQLGAIPFQDYFVRLKCAVPVSGFSFAGISQANYNPLINDLRMGKDPLVIIICPSNPYVSIDPILGLPGLREWIVGASAPVIAVSPIVGGAAIKGPAAKMMQELGQRVSAFNVARHYAGIIRAFVLDDLDIGQADEIVRLGIGVRATQTVMRTHADRVKLAGDCLSLAKTLLREKR